MNKCPKCGCENPDKNKYCESCGYKFDEKKVLDDDTTLNMLAKLGVIISVMCFVVAIFFTVLGFVVDNYSSHSIRIFTARSLMRGLTYFVLLMTIGLDGLLVICSKSKKLKQRGFIGCIVNFVMIIILIITSIL